MARNSARNNAVYFTNTVTNELFTTVCELQTHEYFHRDYL